MGSVANLWDLEADLATLDALEGAWKSQVKQLSWAADTINDTANRVVGGAAWVGETADRYDQHRRKLVGDLDKCAELTDKVARALGECAQVLRHNQGLLTTEQQKLANIRSDNAGGKLTFYPANDQEKKLVNDAVQAANEIRGRVDQELNAQAEVFNSALGQLRGWERTWSARTMRMVNYNIQQGGGGNSPWPWSDEVGTDEGDLGKLAQRIIDGKVDVATLQEVFKGSAEKLEEELNKRAAPGERFEVHFGKASNEWHADDGGFPIKGKEDVGNAVVVRTGNGVTTGPTSVHDLGPGDEPRSATKVQINVR